MPEIIRFFRLLHTMFAVFKSLSKKTLVLIQRFVEDRRLVQKDQRLVYDSRLVKDQRLDSRLVKNQRLV